MALTATWMDVEIIMLSEISRDSETPTSNIITYMCNLKKGHNELLCRTDTDSQILKNMVSKGDSSGVGGCSGIVRW